MQLHVNSSEDQALLRALEPSLKKLNQMLKMRFGSSINFVPAAQLADRFDNMKLSDAQYFYADTSAYLPVFIDKRLKGVLKISQQNLINTIDREQLFEVIGETIEARLENKYLADTLAQAIQVAGDTTLESKIDTDILTNREPPAHVGGEVGSLADLASSLNFTNEVFNHRPEITLNRFRKNPSLESKTVISEIPNKSFSPRINNVIPIRAFREVPHPVINKFREKSRLNFSFLIEGQSEEEIFKMALEVHERSNRVAFIRIEDLALDTFDTVESIHNLGATTIFISNVLSLPFQAQRGLERYFDSARDAGSPQFVSGCAVSLNNLKDDPRILNTLLPALSAGYLRMTQPFSFYRKENLIDFFYESLTGRITT